MQRTKKGAAAAKSRSLRRAELLLLEAQGDILEHRIEYLEKFPAPPGGRKLKREFEGPALPDRLDGNKRAKHEGAGSMTLDEMFNQCRKILTQLKKNNNSGPFLAPVDPIALNCPDYFKIVKQPMDFKTITAKLRPAKRLYLNPLDFRDDVRQVFTNCTLYNPIGNQIRIMGDRLSECFESLWVKSGIERSCPPRPETQKRGRDREGKQESGRGKKIKTCRPEEALKKLNGIQTRLLEVLTSARDKMGPDAMEIDMETPLTFWQKRQLNEKLEKAVEVVVMEVGKFLTEKQGDEKGEMRMDDMTDEELHRLWACMKIEGTEIKQELEVKQTEESEPVVAQEGETTEPQPAAAPVAELLNEELPVDEGAPSTDPEPVKEETVPEADDVASEHVEEEPLVDELAPTTEEPTKEEMATGNEPVPAKVAAEEPAKDTPNAEEAPISTEQPIDAPTAELTTEQPQEEKVADTAPPEAPESPKIETPVEDTKDSERLDPASETVEPVENSPTPEKPSLEKCTDKASPEQAPVQEGINGTGEIKESTVNEPLLQSQPQ